MNIQKTFILIFIIITCNSFSLGQNRDDILIQLGYIEGAYYSEDNNTLIVPKFNLKEDQSGNLYYNDSLVFIPQDKYDNSIYQIFKNRYLVITAYTPVEYRNISPELYEKGEIIVIDTKFWDKRYYFDLKGSIILSIYKTEDGLGITSVERKYFKQFKSIKN